MTTYIANAFSPSMVALSDYYLSVLTIPLERAVKIVREQQERHEVVSCVGHANTAAVFSSLLETEVPMNRVSVKLGSNDSVLVGTPNIRLPEGATELPEGTQITWILIDLC